MHNKYKICALVVTYMRAALLKECLNALLAQTVKVDKIYVIDNDSSDGTDIMMKSEFNIPQIEYINIKGGNIGPSACWGVGMEKAIQNGYDWIWMMDDDAEPEKEALSTLTEYFYLVNVSCLACVVKDRMGNIQLDHRGMIDFKHVFPTLQKKIDVSLYKEKDILEIDMASFVGILLKSESVKMIGYPNKYFFLHHDDVEYCIRLKKTGKLFLITKSIIIHKEQAVKVLIRKKFFHIEASIHPYEKLWIKYYGKRNLIWLGKKYCERKFNFYIGLLKQYIFTQINILLFDDHKMKRTIFYIMAMLDGLRGIFDNDKPKHILYKCR